MTTARVVPVTTEMDGGWVAGSVTLPVLVPWDRVVTGVSGDGGEVPPASVFVIGVDGEVRVT